MKSNPSNTKLKSLNLQNRLSNITRIRRKKKKEKSLSNLYANMQINLRNGSRKSLSMHIYYGFNFFMFKDLSDIFCPILRLSKSQNRNDNYIG